jgi:uncharacterized membrane protein YhaH (DUF805 family)
MKEWMMTTAQDVYTLSGIRGRKSYVTNFLVMVAFSFVMAFIFGFIGVIPVINIISIVGFPILYLVAGAGHFCLAYTRLADLKITRLWAFLAVVPVANLLLFVVLALTKRDER